MKVYEDHYNEPRGESLLPDFFFVQSSSMQVNNSFMTVQGSYGQMPTSEKGSISARTFSITGNVESDRIEDVEKLRSHIFSILYGKVLWLAVNDNDSIYYKVLLDGAINISYNVGSQIARVFTFSFTFKAFEGVSWDKNEDIKVRVFLLRKDDKAIIECDYKGDVPTLLMLQIWGTGSESFRIKKSLAQKDNPFIKCGKRELRFVKDTEMMDNFDVIDGIPLADEHNSLLEYVDKDCLAKPLILNKGRNEIIVDLKSFIVEDENDPDEDVGIYVKARWRNCYF